MHPADPGKNDPPDAPFGQYLKNMLHAGLQAGEHDCWPTPPNPSGLQRPGIAREGRTLRAAVDRLRRSGSRWCADAEQALGPLAGGT
jgi:hypothetical protein